MAYLKPQRPEKVTAPSLRASKERGERLVCLTAYDYPTARIVDEAGVDMILVGDSIGNVIHGYGNTIPVSLDEILSALIAVKRATERAMVIAENLVSCSTLSIYRRCWCDTSTQINPSGLRLGSWRRRYRPRCCECRKHNHANSARFARTSHLLPRKNGMLRLKSWMNS